MSPELYFAVMLITNPQKARRILLAEELENWFMDLFDEELNDIEFGIFLEEQENYVNRIADKILEATGVSITAEDEYSIQVINRAIKTATQIQETTRNHLLVPIVGSEYSAEAQEIASYIQMGVAFSGALLAAPYIQRWFDKARAEAIANNESNWFYNHEEFFEAKSKYSKKIWHTALDEKVRLTHIALEGVEIGISEHFQVGAYLMDYPLDDSYGAGAEEIVNCRCTVEYK